MGLEIVGTFFAGLIWWEIVIFLGLIIGLGASLYNETALGFFIAFGIFSFINWSGTGSLWATITLSGLLYYGLIFIAIGIGWSLFKWKLLVQREIEDGKRRNFSKEEIKKYINKKKDYDTISYWILLWPFSAFGYFVNDFIYDTMKKLIDKIYTLYDRITDRLLGDYQEPGNKYNNVDNY